jgi:hypothetical protein
VKYANMGLLKYVGYDRLFVRAGGHDVGKEWQEVVNIIASYAAKLQYMVCKLKLRKWPSKEKQREVPLSSCHNGISMPFRYSLSCLYSSDGQQNLSLLLKPKFQYSARTNASLTSTSFYKIRLNVIFPLCLDLPNPIFPPDQFITFSSLSGVLLALFRAAYFILSPH